MVLTSPKSPQKTKHPKKSEKHLGGHDTEKAERSFKSVVSPKKTQNKGADVSS